MGKRRDRFDLRALNQKLSKSVNSPLKVKERQRRTERMLVALKQGKQPYPRHVRSWLCAELGKQEHQITQADIDGLLKPKA